MKKLKTLLLAGAVCLAAGSVQAQNDSRPVVYETANFKGKPVEFPGGTTAWKKYVEVNLQYPQKAIDAGTTGVVSVEFIVEPDGSIRDVTAKNDPGNGLADEALRLIKKGPKWQPAVLDGRPVAYRHVQTLTFRLE